VEVQSIADKMFEAPFMLLAHDRCSEGVADEDAVFTYANQVRDVGSWCPSAAFFAAPALHAAE
jgi:hypothetical protein